MRVLKKLQVLVLLALGASALFLAIASINKSCRSQELAVQPDWTKKVEVCVGRLGHGPISTVEIKGYAQGLVPVSIFREEAKVLTEGRELKGDHGMMKRRLPTIQLEDYHLIDPVPSSKATIKSGPIEHGTPLIPYIPQPPPPQGQPTHPGTP